MTISAAQAGPTLVALSASPTGIVSVPANVTVPAGQTMAPITVGTVALGNAMVQASLNGSTASAAIHVAAPAPAVTALTPSPMTVVVGATGQLTVTINAAQEGNTPIAVSVDHDTVLQVPASVTVATGQTQAMFTVTGLAVGDATVTASVGTSSQQALVHVVPPPAVPVTLLPNPLPLQQGATGTLTLTINAAQLSDTVVPLSNSDPTIVSVPASVTVPAGQTSATVPVTALQPGSAQVSASLNGTTVSTTVQVTPPPPVVTSLTPATLSLPKGKLGTLRVTVNRAPTDPTPVPLSSDAPGIASVPASVTIPAGALFADFPVMTHAVGNATITASLNGGSATSQVTVTPPELETLQVSPDTPTVYVGETVQFTATGTMTDSTTQDFTTQVTWTSSDENVATIAAGGLASTHAVGTATITATFTTSSGPITATAALTVETPPALTLSPTSTSLRVGDSVTFTVTSAEPAGPSGLTITLSTSGSGAVTLSTGSVALAAGATSATFTATGSAVGSITLTASAPIRLPASATLTITPPPPMISSFSPTAGKTGDSVSISGTNFTNVQSVTFNGVGAGIYSVMSSVSIVATVPTGATTGRIAVTTANGTALSASDFTIVAITSFTVTPTLTTLPTGQTWQLRATATFSDGTTRDLTNVVAWGSSNAGAVSVNTSGLAQGVAQGTATVTGTYGGFAASGDLQVTAQSGQPLPPDPVTTAPPVSPTIATAVADSTAFLYTGSNPIQTGVAAGTIVTTRAAVLRGAVKGRDGFPIPGVTVTVFNHPEFGQTLTRPDGLFDLAVNGGGPLTVNYAKTGYLSAQRQVSVPWQDYVVVPDVVLVGLDPQVTSVTTNAGTMQTARGTSVTDSDGTRQATLLFPAGTTATMTLPGGGTQPLSGLSVRATEFTVGSTGLKAMPGELPPTSAYTYAAEFSVDEALAAGATTVTFSQPVITYIENFLAITVGTIVPVGYYDRQLGQWIPAPNGQVIKILSITSGLANVDTNGDGTADSGLGITTAERQQLATLYQPGQSLWRLALSHFTPFDTNWPFAFPTDAIGPTLPSTLADRPCETCKRRASIIGVEDQSLGESVGLAGTPFRLHYQSDRVAGRRSAYSLPIPLSGPSLPASLRRIELEVLVAGQFFTQTFAPTPNQSVTFQWDGRDLYGRPMQGRHLARVRVSYVYGAVYTTPAAVVQSFMNYPSSAASVSTNFDRVERSLFREATGILGAWDSQADALGGWSLSVHHAYDVIGKTLFLGTGARRFTEVLGQTINTVAGNGLFGFQGDGGQATTTALNNPTGAAAGPDGSFYIADNGNLRVRRVSPTGIIITVAGRGSFLYNGDGIPATSAGLVPEGVALGPDGSLYITDSSVSQDSQGSNIVTYRVRRVDPSGIITTFAGTSTQGFSGDGGPATAAQFGQLRGIAVAPDGSVYVADAGNSRIRRIGPDGIVTTVAQTSSPRDVAIGRDGGVYFTNLIDLRVRRLGPDGTVTIVAGTGTTGTGGDGGPATAAPVFDPFGVAVGSDGSLYIAERNNSRIRRVGADGIITTVAGNGITGFAGDNGLAPAATFNAPWAVATDAVGGVFVVDTSNHRIRRIAPALPGLGVGQFLVPSEDGSEVYVFNSAGQHLRTQDPLTSAVRWTFAYDTAGRLSTITDADNNVTTIQRDGAGTPTAIVAPGGQQTVLALDADGTLASVTDPASQTTTFTYASDGLLASLTDPRGGVHRYTYDSQGRLTQDQDAATGFKALTRTEQSTGWTIALTTTLNRTTSYQVENLPNTDLRRTVTEPSGLATVSLRKATGTTTITAPDGTITTPVDGPDPRWGMQTPLLQSLTVLLPSGLTSTLTSSRSVTLSNPGAPLSLTSQTDTLTINGRSYTSTYTQATRLLSTTTPVGRTSSVTLDAKGRVVQEQVSGLDPVSYSYDALGRLSSITQGSGATVRTSTLSYNSQNQLISITDPASRTVGFAYDLAGRITTQTLPDLRQIGYSYDGNGNVTALTPPGRPLHAFTYTAVDLESIYTPPDVGFSPRQTQYTYNLDRQLTLVTRPDGQTIQLGYEPTGGRLSTLTLPGSQSLTYAYHATAGTLTSITAPGSTLAYAYDGSLLLSTTWSGSSGIAGSVSRTYDTNFRISSQSVNGANGISFGYDNDSLLTSTGSETITRHAQHGLITGTTLGAVTDSRTYSSFGELATYTANANGSPVYAVTYTRDSLGRIMEKVETISGQTDTYDYGYDQAGRLQEVKKNGGTTALYNYDSNGNRLSLVLPNTTISGTYDAQDRQITYGDLAFTYTTNGERLTKRYQSTPNTTTSYVYDVLGNLKSVTLPDGTLIEYVVDGQNRRIGKKVNGTLQQGFLYQNQLNVVAELNSSGGLVSRFVYGTKANVPDYMVRGGVTYGIVSDHLGSPRLVINTTDGSIAQRMDYDEFGNVLQDTNPGFQPFSFAGGLYDRQTELVRFGERDYDATTGRWTAKDPIQFKGSSANFYAYVMNNPVNVIDPTGLQRGVIPGLSGGPGDAVGSVTGAVIGAGIGASVGAEVGLDLGFVVGGALGLGAGPLGSLGGAVVVGTVGEVVGGVVGGIIGGYIGGTIGSLFDVPCAGELNCGERVAEPPNSCPLQAAAQF